MRFNAHGVIKDMVYTEHYRTCPHDPTFSNGGGTVFVVERKFCSFCVLFVPTSWEPTVTGRYGLGGRDNS